MSSAPQASAVQHGSFRLYLGAIVLGTLGIQIQGVAVAWQVFRLTRADTENAALALGAIGLAEVIPFVAAVLFAGHVADTHDRRRIARLALLAMTLLGLILFAQSLLRLEAWLQLTLLYAMVTLGGLARSFLTTARQAMIAELLPRELIAGGVRWRNTLFELACVLGPGIAGILLWLGGEPVTYGCMLGCFVGSLVATTLLRPGQKLQSRQPEPIFQSLAVGIRFMLSSCARRR